MFSILNSFRLSSPVYNHTIWHILQESLTNPGPILPDFIPSLCTTLRIFVERYLNLHTRGIVYIVDVKKNVLCWYTSCGEGEAGSGGKELVYAMEWRSAARGGDDPGSDGFFMYRYPSRSGDEQQTRAPTGYHLDAGDTNHTSGESSRQAEATFHAWNRALTRKQSILSITTGLSGF